MQHAVKSSDMDAVEEYFWGKIGLRVRGYRPGESLWVHSNGVNGKPTFHGRSNLSWLSKICNHFGEIAAGSRKSLTLIKQKCFFWEKDPLRANFHKCFPKRHMRIRKHVFLCKFRVIWPTGSRWNRALFNGQKNKISARAPAVASARIAPKICGDNSEQYTRSSPNFIQAVHFRRSYSRTREHRSNAPQSVCNTRRSFSFFAE